MISILTNTAYKDKSGDMYYVMAIAEDSETCGLMVVYHELFGDGCCYVMKLPEFENKFTIVE